MIGRNCYCKVTVQSHNYNCCKLFIDHIRYRFGVAVIYTGLPKELSHYRESSLNRIKKRQPGYIFTNFGYKMSTRILYVRIIYSMYDLICDVISCCVRSCDMGKVNVYDIIVMKNKKKRTHGNRRNLYENLHLKEDFGMEFTAC